jgi:DNA-binding response OmpR family regulator
MAYERILIVDDNPSDVKLWGKILELSGYQVAQFTSSEEALDYIKQNEIDLVLADIRMPKIDGFDLLQRSRALYPLLPFVLMTGYGTLDTAIEAMQKEASGLILKPFPPYKQLVQSIRNIIDQSNHKQRMAESQVLQPLIEASEEIPEINDFQSVCQVILDRIFACVTVDSAAILSYLPKTDEFSAISSRGKIDFNALGNYARIHLKNQISGPEIIHLTKKRTSSSKQKSAILFTITRGEETFLFWTEKTSTGEPFKQKDCDVLMIVIRQGALAMENARLVDKMRGLAVLGGDGKDQPSNSSEEIILGTDSGERADLVLLNPVQRYIEHQLIRIRLTPTETKLVKILSDTCCCVVAHEELVQSLHGYRPERNEAATILRPMVSRLKKKLSQLPDDPIQIKNIRGDGYMIQIISKLNSATEHP